MLKKYISFNNLISRISECTRRMTVVRHEIRIKEESGQETEHQKRYLLNLNNEITLLKSKLQNFHRNSRLTG